jgi:hypothetical protein
MVNTMDDFCNFGGECTEHILNRLPLCAFSFQCLKQFTNFHQTRNTNLTPFEAIPTVSVLISYDQQYKHGRLEYSPVSATYLALAHNPSFYISGF